MAEIAEQLSRLNKTLDSILWMIVAAVLIGAGMYVVYLMSRR